jgi:hypothetical protein
MIHNINYGATETPGGLMVSAACTCGQFGGAIFGTVPDVAARFDRLEDTAEWHRASTIAREQRDAMLAQLVGA